jgi:hypothetical protein
MIWKCNFVYALQVFLPKTAKNKAYAFIGRHGLTPYPHRFMLKYKKWKVEVFMDEEYHLPYVLHHEKRLYFPQNYDTKRIQGLYKTLVLEQDIQSPHRYVNSYQELTGFTLLDIGAAEGIFTLDVIDYVQQAYLFECENAWIQALNATFAAWQDKITIVKKYINDVDNSESITLDTFLQAKKKGKIFLKMDIEGYEQAALKGAQQTLSNSADIRCAICTYHKSNDAQEINNILSANGFECQFTEGYLFFEKELRKAVIRACKT